MIYNITLLIYDELIYPLREKSKVKIWYSPTHFPTRRIEIIACSSDAKNLLREIVDHCGYYSKPTICVSEDVLCRSTSIKEKKLHSALKELERAGSIVFEKEERKEKVRQKEKKEEEKREEEIREEERRIEQSREEQNETEMRVDLPHPAIKMHEKNHLEAVVAESQAKKIIIVDKKNEKKESKIETFFSNLNQTETKTDQIGIKSSKFFANAPSIESGSREQNPNPKAAVSGRLPILDGTLLTLESGTYDLATDELFRDDFVVKQNIDALRHGTLDEGLKRLLIEKTKARCAELLGLGSQFSEKANVRDIKKLILSPFIRH